LPALWAGTQHDHQNWQTDEANLVQSMSLEAVARETKSNRNAGPVEGGRGETPKSNSMTSKEKGSTTHYY
jgi:hypothetical protein